MIWTPTMKLRFETREIRSVEYHIVLEIHSVDINVIKVLQQQWICKENGKTRWQDIPTVEEPKTLKA